jgi:hypothetical protein
MASLCWSDRALSSAARPRPRRLGRAPSRSLRDQFTNSAISLGLALPVQNHPLDFFLWLREVRPRDQP